MQQEISLNSFIRLKVSFDKINFQYKTLIVFTAFNFPMEKSLPFDTLPKY